MRCGQMRNGNIYQLHAFLSINEDLLKIQDGRHPEFCMRPINASLDVTAGYGMNKAPPLQCGFTRAPN